MGRRIFVDRVRYISAPSDYIMLALLLIIGVSGAIMTFTSNHTDVVMVKEFASGLITFNWSELPTELQLLVHLLLVIILIAIFPISKLLHVPGVFFSPTRNQVDDARKKRHISSWALDQEKNNEVRLDQIMGEDE